MAKQTKKEIRYSDADKIAEVKISTAARIKDAIFNGYKEIETHYGKDKAQQWVKALAIDTLEYYNLFTEVK